MFKMLLFVLLALSSPVYSVFSSGDVILGVTMGGGNKEYSSGDTGAVINFSSEVIVNFWGIGEVYLGLGTMINGSMFFTDGYLQGGMSMMPTFHLSFLESVDWYIGVGFGMTMHKHLVLYGAGFSSGFNVLVREWFMIGIGVDLQGPQVFGSVGFKFLVDVKY